MRSLPQRFENSFQGPKTDKYNVWRWRYTLFCKKDESRLWKRKFISIFDEISPPIKTKHIRTWTKKGWNESKYGINVSVSYWLMIWAAYSIFKSFNSISIYSQPLLNLQKIVIFSVSNDGIQWTLDFAPVSVTIAVNDLVQKTTINSQELPLAAWQLLLS